MSYDILLVDKQEFDHIPVAKFVPSRKENPDIAPYAQIQSCYLKNQGLVVRIWTFDVETLEEIPIEKGSHIGFEIRINGKSHSIVANKSAIIECGNINKNEVSINVFYGEDLQGIYYGLQTVYSEKFIEDFFGKANLLSGDLIEINAKVLRKNSFGKATACFNDCMKLRK